MKYRRYIHTATTEELMLNEHMMYGSSRLGTYATNEFINDTLPAEMNLPANQRFELTDHLGTVRAVVTGEKTNGEANILALTDYYPFGMDMPGRVFTGENYRFGYQGSERDRELIGGNAYTTFFRQLDPRLGRWMSPDSKIFPWQSPYISMDNNPISLFDPLGASTEGDPIKPSQANQQQKEGNIQPGDVVKTNGGYYEYQVEEGFGNWVKIDYAGNPGTPFNDAFDAISAYSAEAAKRSVNTWGADGKIYQQVTSNTLIVSEPGNNTPEYHFIIPQDFGDWNEAGSDGLIYKGCMSCHSDNGAYRYAAYNSRERIQGKVIGTLVFIYAMPFVIKGNALVTEEVTVEINGQKVPIFRGGEDFTLKPNEFRVTPAPARLQRVANRQ